jgi:isopentenyl diphosphate isomerase/L-lactate dehydrogenase-like FMN-dependent dehydrogenase
VERAKGEPALCRDNACIELKGGECPLILDEGGLLSNPIQRSVIPIGAFAVLDDPGQLDINSYRLALQQFTIAEGSRWPFVFVVCSIDKGIDSSLEFLTRELQVPVVIAPLGTQDLTNQSEKLFASAAHVPLLLSPFAADSSLAAIDDDERLWFLLPSSSELTQPFLGAASAFMAKTPAPARVAVLVSKNYIEMRDVAVPVLDGLRDLGAETLRLDISDEDSEQNRTEQTKSYGLALAKLLEFQPTLVMPLTDASFLEELLPLLEMKWPTPEPPAYVLSFGQLNEPEQLSSALDAHAGLAGRLVGVNYASAAPADAAVQQRYWQALAALRGQTVGELIGANAHIYENFYDSAWFAMYAAVAAGANQRKVTDGSLVARGMLRIVAGAEVIDAGEGTVTTVVAALAEPTKKIRLRGALGTLDFDLDTRGPRGTGSVFCPVDGADTVSTDVARFDQKTRSYDAAELAQCAAF